MYSRIKIFGHPIHPMLIAYPVAFYTGTLAAYVIYGISPSLFWLKLAIALNTVGVGMAVVAAGPGFLDWLLGIPGRTRAKRDGLIHLSLNVIALAVFAIALGTYIGDWSGPAGRSATLGIILGAIGVGLTVAAGFFGWILVQDHHVGVRLTRAQAQAEPAREPIPRAG